MLFRVGLLVVASAATLALTHIRINSSRKPNSGIKGSNNCSNEHDEYSLQQEQVQEAGNDKFQESDVEPKQEEEEKNARCNKFANLIPDNDLDFIKEIEHLKNVLKKMQQRRVTLEVKLLGLYALKEEDIAEQQKHLKAKAAEIDMLNGTINDLKDERQRLLEERKDNLLAERELGIAKRRILDMEGKIRADAAQVKGEMMLLKKQMLGFQEGATSTQDAMAAKRLKALQAVELKVVEMKRRNKELQLEKRELETKLVAAQHKIAALSNIEESRIIAKLEEEVNNLRHANQNLVEKVDRLQKKRFGIIEELVYQRWLNACLRFEVQEHRSHKAPKRDPGRKLTLSLEKIEKLTEDPNSDSSFLPTTSAESSEIISRTTSSSSSQKSVHKKSGLFYNIRRWGKSKDDSRNIESPSKSPKSKKSLIRRFSMPIIPSTTRKKELQDPIECPETPREPRLRRVSFSDEVKPVALALAYQDMPESENGLMYDGQPSARGYELNLTKNANSVSSEELEEEKANTTSAEPNVVEAKVPSSFSKQNFIDNKTKNQVSSKKEADATEFLASEMPHVNSNDKSGDQMIHLIAALIFILLLLLIYVNTFLTFP